MNGNAILELINPLCGFSIAFLRDSTLRIVLLVVIARFRNSGIVAHNL
ncbi:hypothetical protein [Helicobacter sp. MIT 05-5294]|nr:hypothetical protein [Helicobacter sp. MIT 05-5294]